MLFIIIIVIILILILITLQIIKYYSSFFTSTAVSDSGAGKEVFVGTPLRMPLKPDFEAFKKAISQLPDIDPPYVFGLPDNIERSLQRTTSAAVIRQLRALSNLNTEASKFDREKWRVQLGPILDLWQHLTSNSTGILAKPKSSKDHGSSTSSLDDFVVMENKLAAELCSNVDQLLSALKKVRNFI